MVFMDAANCCVVEESIMEQWIYTAQYDSSRITYDSVNGEGVEQCVDNVSQIIIAGNKDEAAEIAKKIALDYQQRGKVLRNERLEVMPEARAFTPVAADLVDAPVLVCKRCGALGHCGESPFTTLPDSGLCDDCVA